MRRCRFRFVRHSDTRKHPAPFTWRAYCDCGRWASELDWANTSRARAQARRAWRDIHHQAVGR
jgi:hypothetical protein